jgi:hypothetical protein
MLRCVRCGTDSPPEAQFCDECGERLHSFSAGGAAERQKSGRLTMNDSNNTQIEEIQPDSLAGWSGSLGSETGGNGNATRVNHSSTVIEPKSNGFAHARLVIERGKNAGKEFILSENEVNIGRWDADNGIFPDVDLDADDPEAKVSRRHARIVRFGADYLLEDLGSTNGTFVNRGRRLLPGNRQIITDGDEIIVGKTFLRFQVIS